MLRAQALSAPSPEFPAVSFRLGKTGTAVADVVVGKDGSVKKIDVLEAPDIKIAEAVEAAVRRWSFKPFLTIPDRRPVEVTGRLLFSFTKENGRAKVTDLAVAYDKQSARP